MLADAWNQVAGWGIEAIKNIQTHVGLGDEDGSNDECVPAPLPAVAGQPSKPEHREAASAASVRVGKGALAALKAESEMLTKACKAFPIQVAKLRDEMAVARANKGKLVISTHGDSFGAEEYENEPFIKEILHQLHHLNIREETQKQRLAFLEDQIEHDSSYIHIDLSPFKHHNEGSSKHTSPVATSPVASHRGSGSASPVRGSSPDRHTRETTPTHMGRRLSTEGSSSMIASAVASSPQGGSRRISTSSRHASSSPVRGASHPPSPGWRSPPTALPSAAISSNTRTSEEDELHGLLAIKNTHRP